MFWKVFAHDSLIFLLTPLVKPSAKARVFANFTDTNWLVDWLHKELANSGYLHARFLHAVDSDGRQQRALLGETNPRKIKYATAMRLGTAETEAILRRFTSTGPQHPAYLAFLELGKAVKTIFLCQYLELEELRREIQEGLNVIENWNGANDFIFYGRSGEFATNRLDQQELSALSLHLLQSCLVYVNTLLIQRVLDEPEQLQRMKKEDMRGLTPLIYHHVTPYGMFRLDLSERIEIEERLSA